jgi:DNA-binding NarL/FixJ family response regulator
MLIRIDMQRTAPRVRVLIVDDQEPFRRAARAVVECTDGFEMVGEVETGEAAVEAAHVLQPDLVLMDVHLPGISGLQASRRILAEHGARGPTVFLLSTYEAADYASSAAACGAAAYLPKAAFGSEALAAAWAAAGAGCG